MYPSRVLTVDLYVTLAVYPLAAVRYLTGSESTAPKVRTATALGQPAATRIDRGMHAAFEFPSSVTGETYADFAMPGWGPFGLIPHFVKNSMTVKLEGGEIYHYGLTLPHHYHKIKVSPVKGPGRVEKAYVFSSGLGQPWWSSYVHHHSCRFLSLSA